MTRRFFPAALPLALLLAFPPAFLAPAALHAQAERDVLAWVVSDADPAGEAGRLAFASMGLEAGALSSYSPTPFRLEGGKVLLGEAAPFRYRADKPRKVAMAGAAGLWSIAAGIRVELPKRADRTVEVFLSPAVLAAGGGMVQPGRLALEAAIRELGVAAGKVWLVEMRRLKDGRLAAKVGFDL